MGGRSSSWSFSSVSNSQIPPSPSACEVSDRQHDPHAKGGFANISGLKLEGSSWSSSGLTLSDGGSVNLGPSQLSWERIDACKLASRSVNVPVYLNGDRLDVLFAVDLASAISQATVAQRGVCVTAA